MSRLASGAPAATASASGAVAPAAFGPLLRPARPKASRRGRIARDRQLESAHSVFVEAGVNGVGLEQIAHHAGVTRGAVPSIGISSTRPTPGTR